MSGDEEAYRPIKVVLDASAIVEFTRASIHVGETLAEIVGRAEAASAALTALDNGCAVFTRHPGLYAGMEADGLTLAIEE